MTQNNGALLRGGEFFPLFKAGVPCGTFQIFVKGEVQVDAEEGDFVLFGKKFRRFSFTVGLLSSEVVVEVTAIGSYRNFS